MCKEIVSPRLKASRKWQKKNAARIAKMMRDRVERDPLGHLIVRARFRARRAGIPFDITSDAFPGGIPDRCPILGIPLHRGKGRVCPNSPTIDRIEPHIGYVSGNVIIISHKANRMKAEATVEELKTFARYVLETL